MSPSRLFILRPVATTLLMVGVVLVGWVAFMQLPVSALPEVDYPTIQVVTFYPGADPEVMASSVTSPLERQFAQIAGVTQLTSLSSLGVKPGTGIYSITGLSSFQFGSATPAPFTDLNLGDNEQADAATAFDDNGTGTTK